MSGTYPKDEMQDTNTSFCFVCFLHLANERGSEVEVGASPGTEEGDNEIGDRWGPKVHSLRPLSVARELINSLFWVYSLGAKEGRGGTN